MLLSAARVSSVRAHLITRSTSFSIASTRWYRNDKYAQPVRLRGPILPPHEFTPSQLPQPTTPEPLKDNVEVRRSGERDPNLLTLDHSRRFPQRPQQGQYDRRADRGGQRLPQDDWVARQDPIPYKFSKKVQQWIDRHRSPLTPGQVDEIIDLVNEAPLASVNAAVYNLVFALLGREGKYSKMWKLFNTMKKRNVKPTSRTYTTLLNAFAQVAHSGAQASAFTPADKPELLTLDRVRVIYEQSQRHIKAELQKAQPEDTGLDLPAEAAEDVNEIQVNILPTNAYLKFLGRFGMWKEMQEVFLGMDPIGPLSPDQVTYTTLFHAINNIDHYRRSAANAAVATTPAGIPVRAPVKLPDIQTGPAAKLLWDQAVRGLTSPQREAGRALDENLALAALQCFVAGRPEDARLVESLIPRLWGLAAPGKPGVASAAAPAPAADTLPRFKLSVRSATALLSLLARMQRSSLAAHYTHLVLGEARLQEGFDLPFLRVAVHNLCAMHDVEAALGVLDMYAPGTGKDGWPADILHALLSAARWAKDWPAALDAFRRFTFLPPGIENGAAEGAFVWASPNGRAKDCRGKKWVRPAPKTPDARAMDLLVRAALASGKKASRQALNVFAHTGPWFTATSDGVTHDLIRAEERLPMTQALRRRVGDLLELARNVEIAAERVLEKPKDDAEKAKVGALLEETRAFVKRWAGKDLKALAKKAAPKAAENGSDRPRRDGERGGAREGRGDWERRPRRDDGERGPREFRPRREEGSREFRPRREDGGDRPREFRPRREDGSRDFRPRREGGGDRPREFRPRREEGSREFRPRREGAGREYRPRREERGDGPRAFKPRRGGFGLSDRGERGGGRERSFGFERKPRREDRDEE